jgi:hypothetical protein
MPMMPTVLVFDGLILATVAVCRRAVVLLVMAGVRVWVDGVVLLVVVAVVVLRRVVVVVLRAFFLPVLLVRVLQALMAVVVMGMVLVHGRPRAAQCATSPAMAMVGGGSSCFLSFYPWPC